MNRLSVIMAAVLLPLLLLSGCKRDIQSTEAVRQGVLTYLAKRSDLLSMDVSITNVVYQKDEATATVHVQAKGSNTAGAGMDLRYLLERKGNEWVVKGRAGGAPRPPPTAREACLRLQALRPMLEQAPSAPCHRLFHPAILLFPAKSLSQPNETSRRPGWRSGGCVRGGTSGKSWS